MFFLFYNKKTSIRIFKHAPPLDYERQRLKDFTKGSFRIENMTFVLEKENSGLFIQDCQ
jgi:hypothetical protein